MRYQSIQARVKKRKKLREKYLDTQKNYTCLDDITDQAALRVITYYEDEVDRVAEVIRREFMVIPEMSVDKRHTQPDRFGYHALNFVCTHTDQRKSDVQFKKYAHLRFEIQVTSIFRHAWSEIEHEWYDLKDAYPDEIKRRFYLLAALLEIAESEFLKLRELQTSYKRSVDVRVAAEMADIPVDALSLKAFASRDPNVARIDGAVASKLACSLSEMSDSTAEHWSNEAKMAGLTSLQIIGDSLRKYESGLLKYIGRCLEFWPRYGSGSTTVERGISVSHLAMMLISAQGEDKVLQAIGMDELDSWITSQVAVAREILAEYRD